MNNRYHGLRTPREEIAFTARPKFALHSQIFRYGGSIFCLPHRPIFSDIFDLCLHWVSVVRGPDHQLYKLVRHVSLGLLEAKICWDSYLEHLEHLKTKLLTDSSLEIFLCTTAFMPNLEKPLFFPCLSCPQKLNHSPGVDPAGFKLYPQTLRRFRMTPSQ